jgi:hypothetical protein
MTGKTISHYKIVTKKVIPVWKKIDVEVMGVFYTSYDRELIVKNLYLNFY